MLPKFSSQLTPSLFRKYLLGIQFNAVCRGDTFRMSVSYSRGTLLTPLNLAMLIVSEGFPITQGYLRECLKVVWILARHINKA